MGMTRLAIGCLHGYSLAGYEVLLLASFRVFLGRVCVCVRACLRACVRACVCVRACFVVVVVVVVVVV